MLNNGGSKLQLNKPPYIVIIRERKLYMRKGELKPNKKWLEDIEKVSSSFQISNINS